MQKIYIVGKNRQNVNKLKETVKKLGFQYSKLSPGIVISLGGDGTFLYSERKYPGIPKLLMRDSRICQKCNNLEFDEMLMKISLNDYTTVNHMKLEARYKNKKYTAVNDFVIRNKVPVQALRFEIIVGNRPVQKLIGDGIVVSTPFGSTGYYNSISRMKFKKGIGIAFNNTTTPVKHLVLNESSIVKIKILRHKAYFGTDNDPAIKTLKPKESLTIRKSRSYAKIVKLI